MLLLDYNELVLESRNKCGGGFAAAAPQLKHPQRQNAGTLLQPLRTLQLPSEFRFGEAHTAVASIDGRFIHVTARTNEALTLCWSSVDVPMAVTVTVSMTMLLKFFQMFNILLTNQLRQLLLCRSGPAFCVNLKWRHTLGRQQPSVIHFHHHSVQSHFGIVPQILLTKRHTVEPLFGCRFVECQQLRVGRLTNDVRDHAHGTEQVPRCAQVRTTVPAEVVVFEYVPMDTNTYICICSKDTW
jgi:hypothetical protein